MTCEEVRELLPAYVLDALSDDDRDAVVAHLEHCQLHAELASFRAIANGLLALAPEQEPPRDLRQRIVATTGGADRQPTVDRRARSARWTLNRLVLPYSLAAGFAVLALVLGFWGTGRGQSNSVARTQIATSADGSSLRALYLPRDGALVLEITDLKPAAAGRIYQAWAIRSGSPVSLGIFDSGPDGRALVALQATLQRGVTIAITAEPAGGSAQPTTQPFLMVGL